MRVLLLNDYLQHGGVEVVVQRTARILEQAGHEVRVLAGDQIISTQSPLGYIASRRCKKAVARAIDEFNPDVIHVHNLYHLLSPAVLRVLKSARQGTGCRIVMSAHDHHLVCPNPGGCLWKGGNRVHAKMPVLDGVIRMLRYRWDHRSVFHSALRVLQRYWNYTRGKLHLAPDVILSPSQVLAGLIQQLGHPDVRVVLNPLAEIPMDKRNESRPDQLVAVVVGRLDPEKGVPQLIESWPSDLAMTLRIAGTGSDLERCERLITQRQPGMIDSDIQLLGQLTHQQVMSLIAHSDVLIVPSIGSEIAPLVIDEAFVAGTHVLVADQPSLCTAVADAASGSIYNPNDPSDLRKQLMRLDSLRIDGTLNPDCIEQGLQGRTDNEFLAKLMESYAR